MVVFTCNNCGETLHKPKVEKHYQFQCRNYKSLTCVDCFRDFKNDEYNAHTKCITEDERYAAKGTYKNGIVKKGDAKQESWLEMIQSICTSEQNLKPSIRALLETISSYSNVPRKKVKFMNFIKSSSGNRANMQEVEEVWDIIEKHKQTTFTAERKRPNEEHTTQEVKKQKTSPVSNSESKFDYKATILEILTEKRSISSKKLEKKVVKAYNSLMGQCDNEEKVVKKLQKKLKKIPNVSVEGDRISLID